MDYAKGVLSVVAGFMLVLIGPGLLIALRTITQEKATGFAFVSSAFPEIFLSFRFWIPALLFSACFWAASRLSVRVLRVVLFWAPAILVVAIGCGLFILFAYTRVHFGRG